MKMIIIVGGALLIGAVIVGLVIYFMSGSGKQE